MRAKEFTNILYETTEFVVNVPIKIRLDQVDDSEETTVPMEPKPVARVTVVKKVSNGEVHELEPEDPVPVIPEVEDESVEIEPPPPVTMPSILKKKPSMPKDPSKPDPNPVFVSPLQQEIELKKAEVGKESPIIGKLTQDETKPKPKQRFS